MRPARSATSAAAICGVVTTTISDVGISNLVTTARVAAMMQVGIEVVAIGRVHEMMSTSGLLDLIEYPAVTVTSPARESVEAVPLRRAA